MSRNWIRKRKKKKKNMNPEIENGFFVERDVYVSLTISYNVRRKKVKY